MGGENATEARTVKEWCEHFIKIGFMGPIGDSDADGYYYMLVDFLQTIGLNCLRTDDTTPKTIIGLPIRGWVNQKFVASDANAKYELKICAPVGMLGEANIADLRSAEKNRLASERWL